MKRTKSKGLGWQGTAIVALLVLIVIGGAVLIAQFSKAQQAAEDRADEFTDALDPLKKVGGWLDGVGL